jgi:WD40 repeat protein
LASAGDDHTVKLWDPNRNPEGITLLGHGKTVTSLALSPNGKLLATGSQDKNVILWDLSTKKVQNVLAGHSGFVNAVAFSVDGTTLASAGADNTIRLWKTATGEPWARLDGDRSVFLSLAIDPQRGALASFSTDRVVRFWDLSTGVSLDSLGPWQNAAVRCVAIAPHGKLLATATWEPVKGKPTRDVIRLWDLATKSTRAVLEGHTGKVTALVFAADGKHLYSASEDKTVRIWDAFDPAKEPRVLPHETPIQALALAPDGQTLVCAGDGLKMLDTTIWEDRATLRGPTGQPKCVTFIADSQAMATGHGDGTVWLWNTVGDRD